MSTIAAKYTPADLLAMPEGKNYELVDGELVERNVSVLSARVEVMVSAKLNAFCLANKLGEVFSSTNGIQCFSDHPLKVRKPAVSFVRRDRFTSEHLAEGFLSTPPDLVVEVISPNDLAEELNEKVEEYLAARIPLVWVIDPEAQIVVIHRIDGSVTKLRRNDELTGEDVVPGFKCHVAELFPKAR